MQDLDNLNGEYSKNTRHFDFQTLIFALLNSQENFTILGACGKLIFFSTDHNSRGYSHYLIMSRGIQIMRVVFGILLQPLVA